MALVNIESNTPPTPFSPALPPSPLFQVMGEKEEYEKQVKWVAENLSFDKDITVVAFEANIRFVGGLLSAHLICSDPEVRHCAN